MSLGKQGEEWQRQDGQVNSLWVVIMKTICEDSLLYFPSNSEIEDLHSTYIANCVFNSFLSYNAIALNIVTIHAIRNTASMPKTIKTLLLSLAVSDVGIGALVLPFYISLLVGWLQHNSSCSNNEVFHIILYLFSVASFSGVVAVSVDRFLAIHLHLRYQELVTHKRVVALVISIKTSCSVKLINHSCGFSYESGYWQYLRRFDFKSTVLLSVFMNNC